MSEDARVAAVTESLVKEGYLGKLTLEELNKVVQTVVSAVDGVKPTIASFSLEWKKVKPVETEPAPVAVQAS